MSLGQRFYQLVSK